MGRTLQGLTIDRRFDDGGFRPADIQSDDRLHCVKCCATVENGDGR
jgi:hypothetical protein